MCNQKLIKIIILYVNCSTIDFVGLFKECGRLVINLCLVRRNVVNKSFLFHCQGGLMLHIKVGI